MLIDGGVGPGIGGGSTGSVGGETHGLCIFLVAEPLPGNGEDLCGGIDGEGECPLGSGAGFAEVLEVRGDVDGGRHGRGRGVNGVEGGDIAGTGGCEPDGGV